MRALEFASRVTCELILTKIIDIVRPLISEPGEGDVNYFKSVLAGFTASIISGIAFLVVAFVYQAEWSSTSLEDGPFVRAGFTVVESRLAIGTPLVVVLVVSFAAGFIWMVRRTFRPAFH